MENTPTFACSGTQGYNWTNLRIGSDCGSTPSTNADGNSTGDPATAEGSNGPGALQGWAYAYDNAQVSQVTNAATGYVYEPNDAVPSPGAGHSKGGIRDRLNNKYRVFGAQYTSPSSTSVFTNAVLNQRSDNNLWVNTASSPFLIGTNEEIFHLALALAEYDTYYGGSINTTIVDSDGDGVLDAIDVG